MVSLEDMVWWVVVREDKLEVLVVSLDVLLDALDVVVDDVVVVVSMLLVVVLLDGSGLVEDSGIVKDSGMVKDTGIDSVTENASSAGAARTLRATRKKERKASLARRVWGKFIKSAWGYSKDSIDIRQAVDE